MYYSHGKRIFDFSVAIILTFLIFPIILFLCILVKMFIGSPIIFKQCRPGLHEKNFYLYKFRTMVDKYDTNGTLLSDDQRLTTFGKWLRSLSLDELPELINILKGEMSLVGPRPLLVEYLPYYNEQQRLRHTVKPGLTGWAQIHGRNALSWNEKFKLDLWYVNNVSFFLDLKIIFLTVYKIIKREGIHAEGYATMPRFDLEAKNSYLDDKNRK
jgi:sugar transferase EpsL